MPKSYLEELQIWPPSKLSFLEKDFGWSLLNITKGHMSFILLKMANSHWKWIILFAANCCLSEHPLGTITSLQLLLLLPAVSVINICQFETHEQWPYTFEIWEYDIVTITAAGPENVHVFVKGVITMMPLGSSAYGFVSQWLGWSQKPLVWINNLLSDEDLIEKCQSCSDDVLRGLKGLRDYDCHVIGW